MFEEKNSEFNPEAEDFTQIDLLLERWSQEEAEMPAELHQKIMGALNSVSPEKKNSVVPQQKNTKNIYRYVATAALAAGVLLSSLAVGKVDLNQNNYDLFTESSTLTATYSNSSGRNKVACGEIDLQSNAFPNTASSVQAMTKDEFNDKYGDLLSSTYDGQNDEAFLSDNDLSLINWEQESAYMLELLKEQKTELFYAKDQAQKEEIKAKIQWIEKCRYAITMEDTDAYEELLAQSPLNE